MRASQRLTIVASLVAACCAAVSARAGGSTELYAGVRQERLLSALGAATEVVNGVAQVELTANGVLYLLSQPTKSDVRSLTIAVLPTEEAARECERRARAIYPVAPGVVSAEPPVADGFAAWKSSAVLRRDNVVVHMCLWKTDSLERTVDCARLIDALLRDDREIAPRGRFAETPEIVDVGFPQTLTVRRMVPLTPEGESGLWPGQRAEKACVRIRPQFRGLGPVEKLYLHVVIEGLGMNQGWAPVAKRDPAGWLSVPDESGRYIRRVHPSAENDGRFILEIRVPDQPETRKARLIAATEDNLIVTKEVEVTIVPAD